MWSATERASDRLNIGQMQIIRIVDHQKAYLPLLLLADEQEDMIDRYLPRGEYKSVNRHSGLNCCACSCIFALDVILWNQSACKT